MYKIKTEYVYKVFISNNEIFDFSYYLTKSKYYKNLNELVIGKMKDETGGVCDWRICWIKTKNVFILSRQ